MSKPTKEEVELILSQLFDARLNGACLRGKMYGVGYSNGAEPLYAMVTVTPEECQRVGNKLNGKNVVVRIES